MRLLYDLDGTLFHFDERFQELREELYPELTGIPHYTKQLTFNLWKDRTPEEQDAIRVIMNHPGFYRGLKPMEGAVEAVKEADALGYEVAFLSAPWTSNPTCVQDKYNDIGAVFGEEWMDRLILAKHKHMVSGTILFDDKEPIPLKETADWIQVYYDQPYNQGAEGFRIYNWSEWRGVVDQITDELRSESSADRAWRHYENLEAFA